MQSHFSSSVDRSLELEFQQVIRQRQGLGRLTTWLTRSGTALLNFLTGQSALSIRTTVTAAGRCRWTVYDPDTNERHVFDSQRAVRTWLEQRYHR